MNDKKIDKKKNPKQKNKYVLGFILGVIITLALFGATALVLFNTKEEPQKNTSNDQVVTINPTLTSKDVTFGEESNVDLVDYSLINTTYYTYEFDENEYNEYIEYAKQLAADYKDEKSGVLELGDIAVLTYNGWLKEDTAKEGETQSYNASMTTTEEEELLLGSNSYIDGFESGLVGKKVGETVRLELVFPKDYGYEEVNGKEVIFEVTIKAKRTYKEVPSNEKVQTNLLSYFSMEDSVKESIKTFDDFKVWLKNDMLSYYETSNKSAKENAAITAYFQLMPNIVYSRSEYEKELESTKTYYTDLAKEYGMDNETFASTYLGTIANETQTAFDIACESQVLEQMKYNIIMDAVIEKEKIEVSEDIINEYIENMYNLQNKQVSKEDIRNNFTPEELNKEALRYKAVCIITENANLSISLDTHEHSHNESEISEVDISNLDEETYHVHEDGTIHMNNDTSAHEVE